MHIYFFLSHNLKEKYNQNEPESYLSFDWHNLHTVDGLIFYPIDTIVQIQGKKYKVQGHFFNVDENTVTNHLKLI